jgi:hypothetical protein
VYEYGEPWAGVRSGLDGVEFCVSVMVFRAAVGRHDRLQFRYQLQSDLVRSLLNWCVPSCVHRSCAPRDRGLSRLLECFVLVPLPV